MPAEKTIVGELPVGGVEPLISSAVRWGDLLFLSGRAPIDTRTMVVVSDDFEVQARDVLRQIEESLVEAGSGFEHVLRVQCYLLRAEDLEPRLGRDLRGAAAGPDDDRDRVHRARHARRGRGHRRNPLMKVVIAGGGVAGLCTAYYLRKRDVDVTVLESRTVGSRAAASHGNGGWITPAQAGPLPEPGLTIYGLRALMSVDSALYFRPSYLPRLVPWLTRFWTYCNARDHERGWAAMARLGERVFALVDEMAADGVEFELYKTGMICATADAKEAQKVLESMEPMRAFGFGLPETLLTGEELHALEPALSDRVQAGFYVEQQWHVRANTFTEGLARRVRELGAEIVEDAEVHGFDTSDGRVQSVRTARGEFTGDAFLVAAGSWTTPLLRKLGVRIPMQPGKGYTFLLQPSVMPKHGILFADIHAGASPFADRLRISGTMEFSGYNLELDRRRIDNVFRLARDYLRLEQPTYENAWAGLRPMVVDGLPILDRVGPWRNAYVATGYSMLGMTLSQPAGEAMAGMIATGERPDVFVPFRIDRFPRLLVRRPGR
jgi:D-amino-acid dehydrogenase